MGDQLRLNQPMVARLRKCAADTSSNWDGQITIYPPEARDLVAFIDAATSVRLDEKRKFIAALRERARWHIESESPGDATLNDLADAMERELAVETPPSWSWVPPAEPGPEVRCVRPVERYAGDNGIRYEREADNSGWRLVMMGHVGGVIEWLKVVAGAGSIYGGRQLFDATAESSVSTAKAVDHE